MTIHYIRDAIHNELLAAEAKHPNWPDDVIHATAVMNEEAGEAIKAALNHVYHGQSIELLKIEVIQTAAMCYRILKNI